MKIWGFMRTKLLYVDYGQNYYSQNSHLNYNTDLLPITFNHIISYYNLLQLLINNPKSNNN